MVKLIRVLAICLIAVCHAAAQAPATHGMPPKLLEARREAWKAGEASVQPAVKRLLADADKTLSMKPLSVMDKKLTPPGGSKHDYYSFGIYWWPDPSKPDGLPYIRKDGVVNPESREGNDALPFGRTNRAVEELGLAYFFSGKEAYAAKAAALVRVWYLAPETRMNPDMNHAQGIPGKNDGRGIGIIEGSTLSELMDGIALIRASDAWTEQDEAGMNQWLGSFYQWLRTSYNGLDQEGQKNNHGTYYDVLASHLALHLGKKEEARQRLQAALARRVDGQIDGSGKQPHELKRTISFSYTVYNLEAFLQLASLGEAVGVDFWKHRGPRGQGIKPAVDLLIPYADPAKPWDLGQQIKPVSRAAVLPFFQQALRYEDAAIYREALEEHGSAKRDERWRLTR